MRTSTFTLIPLFCLTLPAYGQFQIELDYSYDTAGFFSGENAYRRVAVDGAAAALSRYMSATKLDAIAPSGGNSWTAYMTHPVTDAAFALSNLSIPADTVRIYVGAGFYNTGALAYGGSGTSVSDTGSSDWSETVGFRGTDVPIVAVGTMSFNSRFADNIYWDTDLSNYEGASGQYDAYSITGHELLHALGIGTGTAWSVFTSLGKFIGTEAMNAYGQGQVPLSSDQAHFASWLVSADADGNAQAPLVNPFTFGGERLELTELDAAALRDLGFSATLTAAIPEPSTYATAAGLLTLAGAVLRRRRSLSA